MPDENLLAEGVLGKMVSSHRDMLGYPLRPQLGWPFSSLCRLKSHVMSEQLAE